MVACPQIDSPLAIFATANCEGMNIEQRTHRPKGEAAQLRTRPLAPQKIGQQCGDQRAMHDQTGIALHAGDVAAVIMDAMPLKVNAE